MSQSRKTARRQARAPSPWRSKAPLSRSRLKQAEGAAWGAPKPRVFRCTWATFDLLTKCYSDTAISVPSGDRERDAKSPIGMWRTVSVYLAELPEGIVELEAEDGSSRHVVLESALSHPGRVGDCELAPCPVRLVMET